MNRTSSYRSLQQGAALIAVLIILVIVTLLGVTAMRMGLSGLSLANNSQVSQLLFQTADMGTTQIRNTINENVLTAMDVNGIIGVASGEDTHLCLKPANGTNFTNFKVGACDPTSASDYVSERAVVLTQVTYLRSTIVDGESSNESDDMSKDGRSTSPAGAQEQLKTFSTSVVPSFGSATQATIKDCLQKSASDEEREGDSTFTITDCLTKVGAVFTTHVSEYRIDRQ
jgi:Tfp pilus assembly protein PilX